MNEQLAQEVITLARARRSASLKQLALKTAKEQLEATKEWAAYTQLKDEQTGLSAMIEEIENRLRQLAVETGEKHPHPAVEVVSTVNLHYIPEDAVKWCIETKQLGMLKLDVRGFEKVARVLENIPMVEKTLGHAARIASDLTKWEALDE